MNRRDFLHPRRLARSTGQVLGALDELQPPADPVPPSETALLRLARRAMATTFEVVVPFGTPRAMEIGAEAFDLLDALESQLTVYRSDSEVSRLNRLGPCRPVPVEEGLFGLLERAARLSADTNGAFDVTAGALIKAWGFFRGPRRVPTDEEREEALRRVGMDKVELTAAGRTVRYRAAGLEINLGAIGKGYALDRVAAWVRAQGNWPAVLLHGGHSSVYAKGCPLDEPRGWPVSIRHPWDPERRLALVWLRDRALGTSAATFRHLEHRGRKLGHVLDPRTGWPAAGIASASVVAPSGAEADALSTAFFVGGLELARAYCADHPEVGALLLTEEEPAEPVVLGLAPEQWEPPPAAR